MNSFSVRTSIGLSKTQGVLWFSIDEIYKSIIDTKAASKIKINVNKRAKNNNEKETTTWIKVYVIKSKIPN
jgi:ribosomal protein L13E